MELISRPREAHRRQCEFLFAPRRASPTDPGITRDSLRIGQCRRRAAGRLSSCARREQIRPDVAGLGSVKEGGDELVVTSDKDGLDSEFERELPDTPRAAPSRGPHDPRPRRRRHHCRVRLRLELHLHGPALPRVSAAAPAVLRRPADPRRCVAVGHGRGDGAARQSGGLGVRRRRIPV